MIPVDEFVKRQDLIHFASLFAGSLIGSLIALAVDLQFGAEWHQTLLQVLEPFWPRLSAEYSVISTKQAAFALDGPYLLTNMVCLILTFVLIFRMWTISPIAVDYRSSRQSILGVGYLLFSPVIIVSVLLIIFVYTGFSDGTTRFSRGLVNSPLILVWSVLGFTVLLGVLLRTIFSWRIHQLEKSG